MEVAEKKIPGKKVKSFNELIPDSLKTIVREQAACYRFEHSGNNGG